MDIDLSFTQKRKKINYDASSLIIPSTRIDTKGLNQTKVLQRKKGEKREGQEKMYIYLDDFTNPIGCLGNSADDS